MIAARDCCSDGGGGDYCQSPEAKDYRKDGRRTVECVDDDVCVYSGAGRRNGIRACLLQERLAGRWRFQDLARTKFLRVSE